MFGLGDEVQGDATRIRRWLGQDEALGWAGGQVDGHLAGDLELGRRDPRVARTDDPVDGCQASVREAECQGADGLCATGDDDGVDVEQPRSTEEDGDRRRQSASAGVATTTRSTPATRAGTTVMTSELGYGADPPGT